MSEPLTIQKLEELKRILERPDGKWDTRLTEALPDLLDLALKADRYEVLHRSDHALADLRERERDNALSQRDHLEGRAAELQFVVDHAVPENRLLNQLVDRYRERIGVLEAVIRRVIEDEESRPGGWGPDVTAIGWLKEALTK